MKRFLTLAVLMFLAVGAKAAGGVFSVGYSTMAIVGHEITTGTSVNILRARPSFWYGKTAKVFVQNQDATNAVWCAERSDVSDSTTAKLGRKISAGAEAEFQIGSDPKNGAAVPQLHCIAPSAVGTALVKVALTFLGL